MGCFQWPTLVDPTILCIPYNPTYNRSEVRAWNSGQALMKQITALNREYPGEVRVIAHSMGNVVAGEALRLFSSPVVHTYVAAQGALSARYYDNDDHNIQTAWAAWIETPDVIGHYFDGKIGQPYLKENSTKVTGGQLFNYFNVKDFALDKWVSGNHYLSRP